MNTNFPEKFKKTLELVQYKLHDISLSLNKASTSDSTYRIIPTTKKGKNFLRFNALDMQTSESITIFLSPKTIGVKLYDANGEYICDYSVSKNDEKQITQLNYSDGTSVVQSCLMNPQTHKYEIQNLKVICPTADLVDLGDFPGDIIDDNLYARILFSKNQNDFDIKVGVSFTNNPHSTDNKSLYDYKMHPELLPIAEAIGNNTDEVVESYTKCYKSINSSLYYDEIRNFYNSFKSMTQNLKEMSQNLDNPDSENR